MGTYRESRIVVVLLLLTLAGCAEQTATTQPVPPAPTAPVAAPPAERIEPSPPQVPPPMAGAQAPPSPPAPLIVPAPSQPAPKKVEAFSEQPALKDVLFDANRTELGRHGTQIMKNNARWLIENPGSLVLIEGHSDYKGNREGNVAAGERRAKAAMDFLIKAGVSVSRIQIVSYGSDQPVCPEKTETCAARSRRVHFLAKPQ